MSASEILTYFLDKLLVPFIVINLTLLAGTLAIRVAVKYYRHHRHEKMLYPMPIKDKAVFKKYVDIAGRTSLLFVCLIIVGLALLFVAIKFEMRWMMPILVIFTLILSIIYFASTAFGPWYIGIGSKSLIIRHNASEDNITYSDIESIELATPAPDARCTFGIPGSSGYWGVWQDSEHGTYTACYGRRSQCFFVRLKDGRGYMLGCKDPDEIVRRVKEMLAVPTAH